jgi:hypothetical protein
LTAIRCSQVESAASPLEARQPAIRPHEGILREIGRVGVVAGEAMADSVDRALVAPHDHVEGGAIAGQGRGDEGAVVERAVIDDAVDGADGRASRHDR